MRRHPGEGYRLLRQIGFLKEAAEIVYAHHERFDGSGYPRGLKGEDIPLGARLFMVADVYDAITSERPYHSPLGYDEARAAIRSKSVSHFDPAVVETFSTLDCTELQSIAEQYRA